MFGYFQPRGSCAFSKIKPTYKRYYCGLCHALKYNYGMTTRILLSYDVALFAMLLMPELEHSTVKCKNGVAIKGNVEWKKVAALNVLLFAGKMRDNVIDDGSFLAKCALKFFRRSVLKATRDFPNMAAIINQGYENTLAAETGQQDIIGVATTFADMMSSLVCNEFGVNNSDLPLVRGVSMWLYFIDALDDYDKDAKKGTFNALCANNVTFPEYVDNHWKDVFNYLTKS